MESTVINVSAILSITTGTGPTVTTTRHIRRARLAKPAIGTRVAEEGITGPKKGAVATGTTILAIALVTTATQGQVFSDWTVDTSGGVDGTHGAAVFA